MQYSLATIPGLQLVQPEKEEKIGSPKDCTKKPSFNILKVLALKLNIMLS